MRGSSPDCPAVPGRSSKATGQFWNQSQPSEESPSLSHWWQHPVGGVASAQTQQGYVGPLVSECSLQLEVYEAHSSGHHRKILDKQTG